MRFRRLILTDPIPEIQAPASNRVPIQPAERAIPVLSTDGVTTYPVRVLPDGSLVCPCRGYGYRQACRHATEARGVLEEESRARSENTGVEACPR
jgi:hypothetical protein